MVCVEIRVIRKDKERAARDVAAILNVLKDEEPEIRVAQTLEQPARGLRLAYSAD